MLPVYDTQPLAVLCGCTCPKPTENYPFDDKVFAYIHQIAPLILKYSQKYDVPSVPT
jgi:hypothetical protein